jgi:hypothetical protein
MRASLPHSPNSQRTLWLLFAFFLSAQVADAQDDSSAETFRSNSLEAATSRLIDIQKAIYIGPRYFPYFQKFGKGHPFLPDFSSQTDEIEYDGVLYRPVDLIYDIFKDQVIIENPNSERIILLGKKIQRFVIDGKEFQPVDTVSGLTPGFYEILYNNDIALVAKWSKSLRGYLWKQKVNYFVVTDRAYAIDNKSDLLNVFKDKQVDIKNFIRDNKLNFKENNGDDLRRVVQFYVSSKQ